MWDNLTVTYRFYKKELTEAPADFLLNKIKAKSFIGSKRSLKYFWSEFWKEAITESPENMIAFIAMSIWLAKRTDLPKKLT